MKIHVVFVLKHSGKTEQFSRVLRADVRKNQESRDSLKKPKFCLFNQNILFRELFQKIIFKSPG